MIIGQALQSAAGLVNEDDAKLTIKTLIAANPAIRVAVNSLVPSGDSATATADERQDAIFDVYTNNPIFKAAVRTALFELMSPS